MLKMQTSGLHNGRYIFHSTNLPLVKWFWAIYFVAADKGGMPCDSPSNRCFLGNCTKYVEENTMAHFSIC